MQDKKGNVLVISIIIVIVVITAGVVGWLFAKKTQTPVSQPVITQQTITSTQTQSTAQPVSQIQPAATQQIPTNWKSYTGDLSQLSPQFVGKKISFQYPAEWGNVKLNVEKNTDENGNTSYNVLNFNFSSFPGDKDFTDFNLIKIVDNKTYGATFPKEISFLQKVTLSDAPIVEKELGALGGGIGNGVFFGVNMHRKFAPQNFSSTDKQAKGLTFFMRDGNGFGVDLIYDVVLLNQQSNTTIGGEFYVTSSQQSKLDKELNNIGESTTELSVWDKKMDALAENSYATNPDYMAQVNDINLVMQSVVIN